MKNSTGWKGERVQQSFCVRQQQDLWLRLLYILTPKTWLKYTTPACKNEFKPLKMEIYTRTIFLKNAKLFHFIESNLEVVYGKQYLKIPSIILHCACAEARGGVMESVMILLC